MRFIVRLALGAGLLLAAALPARAQSPDYEGEFFSDYTHSVPTRTSVEISKTLRVGAQQSRVHPMLVLVNRMSDFPNMPQSVDEFATKLLHDWRVGDVDTHKGVLALFSIGDHKFWVVHTAELDRSVNDAISSSFKGGVTDALKAGDVARAMQRAADAIAASLARASSSSSSSSSQPVHTVTTTTHTHTETPSYSRPVSYSSGGSGSGMGCVVGLFGFMVIAFVVISLVSALSGASRGYGGGYYGGGYYGGGGGGGFWSGMATGGLLGYLFGNSGSSSYYSGGGSSGWGGWSSGGSSTDTTTTETWSWGGGSSDSSSSSSSGGGFFDSFGGGSSSGDSGSGGSW
jgi:hypothetical protein